MTKKHFEEIAHTLNANNAPLALVLDFADMCGEFNERFDRGAFVVAATQHLRANMESDYRMLLTNSI